jgi:TetR/AcrR family transcriptional regulator, transcriptional repressor for nem operon
MYEMLPQADRGLLVLSCWEGAALRSRLQRNPTPLDTMLDFYFSAVTSA